MSDPPRGGPGSNQYGTKGAPTGRPLASVTRIPVSAFAAEPELGPDFDDWEDESATFCDQARTWSTLTAVVDGLNEGAERGFIPKMTVEDVSYDYHGDTPFLRTSVTLHIHPADGEPFTVIVNRDPSVDGLLDPGDPGYVDVYVPDGADPPRFTYANVHDLTERVGLNKPGDPKNYGRDECTEQALAGVFRVGNETLETDVRAAAKRSAAALSTAWKMAHAEPEVTSGSVVSCFLQENGGPWKQVTLDEYLRGERAAGFHPKTPGRPATGGFTGQGTKGDLRYRRMGLDEFLAERRSWDDDA